MKNKEYFYNKYNINLYPFQIEIINELLKYKNSNIRPVCMLGRSCGKGAILSILKGEGYGK
jgi:hypothetical protein